ncbi:MAG: prolipoprotein diacylglyceryl transferase, partial [Thermodesulfobacteriota bacterium]|nr:prolipoprotein diacylglyceryl transferase [Thermodesulfobacteriota bacterium]
ALVVYGVIMLFETKLRRYYFKGLSSALFLVLYPLARFIVEFYRGDFRGGALFGLSVSQCLSLVLIALGAAIFIKARKAART